MEFPTDEEDTVIQREILSKIWQTIAKIDDKEDTEDAVKLIISALKIAYNIKERENKKLAEKDLGPHLFDVHSIVATACAMSLLCFDENQIRECHPSSTLSTKIIAFSSAMRIVQAASDVDLDMADWMCESGINLAHKMIVKS